MNLKFEDDEINPGPVLRLRPRHQNGPAQNLRADPGTDGDATTDRASGKDRPVQAKVRYRVTVGAMMAKVDEWRFAALTACLMAHDYPDRTDGVRLQEQAKILRICADELEKLAHG